MTAASIPTNPEELVAQYLPYCRAVGRRMQNTYRGQLAAEDVEEIIQDAMLKVTAVQVEKYSEAVYIKRVIVNAAIDSLDKLRKHWRTLQLDGYPMHIFLYDPAAAASLEAVDARILTDQLLDQVTPLQRRLIEATMGIGSDRPVRQHELARAEHTTIDRVRVQLNQGMAKLGRVAMAAASSN